MRALIMMIVMAALLSITHGAEYPTLLSPANRAEDLDTGVTLVWQTVPGALSYELQVSDELNVATRWDDPIVDETGLTDTAYHITVSYDANIYWKVCAVHDTGNSVWIPHTFSTKIAPPIAPTLESPVDGATNVETPIRLDWANVDNAVTYDVEVYEDSLLTDPYANGTGLITSYYDYMGGFPRGATYYWRANATNSTGTSLWSDVFSFSTPPENPGTPTLLSPGWYATDVPDEVTFVWSQAENAATYTLEVFQGTKASMVIEESGLTDTTFTVSLNKETTYRWEVCAVNYTATVCANFSQFSTVKYPPSVVALLSPQYGAIMETDSVTLTWQAVADATKYWVKVGTQLPDIEFPTDVLNDSTVTGTSIELTGLDNGDYYWVVLAGNQYGWGAQTTEFKSFTVKKLVSDVSVRDFRPRAEKVHLTVLDARGRVIASGATPAHRLNLAKGVYVTVREANGLVTRRAMLVR